MTKIFNIFKNNINKASNNRKLYVFLFCLFLSTLFWLLNSLGKNFTTDIAFNVSYSKAPQGKVVLNELPKEFKIKIKGLGFDLMAYKLRIRKPSLIVNLSKIQGINKQINSIQNRTLASSSFLPYISGQLGDQIEIKQIYPDSIQFLFDVRKEKIVKIIPRVQVGLEKQFQLFGNIMVKPAVTKVSGPASIVDTLKEVYTDSVSFQNLSETVTESIGFDKMYIVQKLKFKPKKVILHIPIEKFTEKSIFVNVEYVNVPDSIIIKAIPSEIELKFMIPLSKMANLGSAVFKAEIDYKQLTDDFNRKLKVEITKYPEYIQSLTLNPEKVEYILKKQN